MLRGYIATSIYMLSYLNIVTRTRRCISTPTNVGLQPRLCPSQNQIVQVTPHDCRPPPVDCRISHRFILQHYIQRMPRKGTSNESVAATESTANGDCNSPRSIWRAVGCPGTISLAPALNPHQRQRASTQLWAGIGAVCRLVLLTLRTYVEIDCACSTRACSVLVFVCALGALGPHAPKDGLHVQQPPSWPACRCPKAPATSARCTSKQWHRLPAVEDLGAGQVRERRHAGHRTPSQPPAGRLELPAQLPCTSGGPIGAPYLTRRTAVHAGELLLYALGAQMHERAPFPPSRTKLWGCAPGGRFARKARVYDRLRSNGPHMLH
jgi:hypothetical protein